MNRFILVGAALVVFITLFGAHEAAAQVYLSPFIATTLTSPTATGSATKPGYGGSFGGVGKIVGFDTEFAYYPEVVDNSEAGLAKSKVVSFSGDLLLGPMMGAVKPYVALGGGNLNLNVTQLSSLAVPSPETISNNYFAFNVGGGAMGFFSKHLGARGDLRYYRAYGINVDDFAAAGFTFDHFNFWRASFGVVVKF